ECAFNDSVTRADAFKNVRPKLPCHVAGREQYRSALRSRHVSPQQFGRRVEAVSIRGVLLEDTIGHESYIHLVPSGALTTRLFNLRIGDRIWLSDTVSGMFTFDDVPKDANVALIATGSGLAPFISMLSTHLKFAAQRRVAVLHGARHSWDLAYRAVLMNMQNLRNNFSYLPIISRTKQEPVPWAGEVGHVQDLWRNGAIERDWNVLPTPDNTHAF